MSWKIERTAVLLTVFVALAMLFPRPAVAAILTVTDLGDSGAPGQLRTLINAAAPGDTIVIPSGTIRLIGQVGIGRDMSLQGAGAGITVIDGSGSAGLMLGISSAAVTISHLTIRNGKAIVFTHGITSGGGIYNDSGPLLLNDVSINDNDGGEGISNSGSMTLTNVTVSGNGGVDGAGGISNRGTMTLTDVTVSGNGGGVGGIFNEVGASATLTNVTVSGNHGSDEGPGLSSGTGGIDNRGSMTLTNVTVSGNGNIGGAGGIGNSGTMTLTNVTVSGNSGSFGAGGIGNGGIITLTNVTVSGNRSEYGYGGGISNGGVLSITNGTISSNLVSNPSTTTTTADGIVNYPEGSVTLRNTIVANSTRNCMGTLTSLGHNVEIGTTCHFAGPGDLSNTDPLLGPLQNNGGPTPTQALLPGSPAIDAGDSVGCPPTDQRGVARPQGTACDIGAYERVGSFDPAVPGAFVTRLYQQVLGRGPEPGAVEGWVQQIRQDGSLAAAVLAFFHAAEFLNRHTSDEQFLTILYRALLNREPDTSSLDAFLGDLQARRLTRDNLLDIFLDSSEFTTMATLLPPLDPVTAFVITLYVRILGRGPDQAGLQAFVTQLQQTQNILPTVQLFLASPEFLGRNTPNTEFVTLLYRVCLGRVADAGGLAFYANRLTQGTATRDQLLAEFAASPEFQAIQHQLFP
jgi:hypothetical protein